MGPAATAAHQQQLNEDHRQALVLFSIVIIFLVTNSPRILINIDEVGSILFGYMFSENNIVMLVVCALRCQLLIRHETR